MRDVKMMVRHVSGLEEADFILRPDFILPPDQISALYKMAERRKAGEPVTRILGVREFWGLEFEVTPNTLDPRPDTETLIEAVLDWAKTYPPAGGGELKILDLGTGTGCIPISLLSELPHVTAVATDISPAALAVARRNAEKHNMSNRIKFIESDWFESITGQKFDIITSNPPYIADQVIHNLEIEVKNHDPILSLSGGVDGLEAYKKIIYTLQNHLNVGGKAFLEIGYDQLESVSRLVSESNLCVCRAHRDIAGNPRVLEISLKA